MSMKDRIVKMLKRKLLGKSMPDFDAVCAAADCGYITMTGPSDDISIVLTAKGEALLMQSKDSK